MAGIGRGYWQVEAGVADPARPLSSRRTGNIPAATRGGFYHGQQSVIGFLTSTVPFSTDGVVTLQLIVSGTDVYLKYA
jgi:hypothetical protein